MIVAPWSFRSACFKFWAIVPAIMLFLLWTCTQQLTSLSNTFMVPKYSSSYHNSVPPERVYENNGYLMFQCNGGLNQMRTGICDMVAVARYLNVTLIVPALDNTSYWNDQSEFQDIFDVDHFITSLRDEVRILKELPPEQKRKVESESLYSMRPISFASPRYYYNSILYRIHKYEVVFFTRTDFRLANNGFPEELQKLRCQVNFKALKFTRPIEELGKKIVRILRQKGPFLALQLRYEMDMLSFTGCTEGCTNEQAEELTKMRYAHPGWKHKEMNSKSIRRNGLCPLTPEETALVLKALGIDRNMQIYIAAGDIYGGKERMANLTSAYNLVRKETLLEPSDLRPFLNHSNQMTALDYIVAVESDIFVPTFGGNMARVVEGHRRYLGFRKTILLDIELLVSLIDKYRNGEISLDKFSQMVKAAHADRIGKPTRRLEIPDQPKDEDYFYSNPQECLSPNIEPSTSNSTDIRARAGDHKSNTNINDYQTTI